MRTGQWLLTTLAPILAAGLVGAILGYLIAQFVSKARLREKQEHVQGLVAEAEAKAKEITLQAKDAALKTREGAEAEMDKRRQELQRQEERFQQRRESLDRRLDELENRGRKLDQRQSKMDKMESDIQQMYDKQFKELERISSMSQEDAKQLILEMVEQSTRQDAARVIRQVEAETREEADSKAREIITLAIQRTASDQVSETTVSTVPLPNDEMKGRIIGRGGRNIRAIENATGVDLIVDDTPEAVTISAFNIYRREIARLTLERLISDGRIHPGRIEEVTEKIKKEMEEEILKTGKEAALSLGVQKLHPELLRLIGRLKYRTSYGQNVLQHSLEVAHLASVMAGELKMDRAIARRAGLLHDIGKSVDQEVEGDHLQIGFDIANRYNEPPEILEAVKGHHNDYSATTPYAVLISAADALSASRPGARRETLEGYIKRLEKLEAIATSFRGVTQAYAISAGREVRVIVKPETITDEEASLLVNQLTKKIEEGMEYPGTIKVTVIREVRYSEMAK